MSDQLPEKIEAAIQRLVTSAFSAGVNKPSYDSTPERTELRAAIRTALTARDKTLEDHCSIVETVNQELTKEYEALRQRAERLRQALIDEGFKAERDEGDGCGYQFRPGDLADDLIPREKGK
jgi:hypothetical protein